MQHKDQVSGPQTSAVMRVSHSIHGKCKTENHTHAHTENPMHLSRNVAGRKGMGGRPLLWASGWGGGRQGNLYGIGGLGLPVSGWAGCRGRGEERHSAREGEGRPEGSRWKRPSLSYSLLDPSSRGLLGIIEYITTPDARYNF